MFAFPRFHHSKSAVFCLSVLAAMAAVPATQAQTQITFDAQIPFSFSSPTLVSPRGIAVAADGTVYLADVQTGTTGRVVQITPTTGTVTGTARGAASLAGTVVTLAPSITVKRPTAVAVDSTGALYIADGTDGVVIEMAAPETSSAATLITYPGTETPTALATDSSNNLYIADETQNAIYKVVAGTATKLNLSSTVLKPVGLAADSSGNVYFADALNNEVYKYTASTTSAAVYLTTSSAGNFRFSLTTAYPIGMGFDPAGSLYVLDNDTGNLIQVISPSTSNANVELPLSSALTPAGMTVSSIGNLYVSDDAADTADEVFYNNNPFNFGSLPADYNGSNALASPAVTVNFQFNTRARGVAIYESMQGDVSTEFHTRSTLCSGSTGSTCSMAFYVEYSSSFPGTRNGAVGLTDNAGNILAAPNTGIDLAGALALYPGIQATLSQTTQPLYEPQGLAVTGNGGTLFVADEGGTLSGGNYVYTHGAVWAYPATEGTPGSTPTEVGLFPTPMALALDPVGDLYVADYSGTVTVVPVSYNSTSGNTWTVTGTPLNLTGAVALNHPMALTFDPSGNLYIGDMGPAGAEATASNPGYIIKVPANGGPATRLNYTVGGVPVVFPQALTTDAQGNLYIADGGDGDSDQGGVDVVTVATGTASSISFGSFAPLSQPSGLGFDAANDLYVLDGYNQRVLVVPITFPGGVPTADTTPRNMQLRKQRIAFTSTAPTVDTGDISLLGQGLSGLTSALVTPSNLVVWQGGQYITISDIGYQPASGTPSPTQVLTLQSFNSTVYPTTTTPATVNEVNTGNQQITFKAPSPGDTSGGFTLSGGCGSAAGDTLGAGVADTCVAAVQYSGSGSGNVTFTLNGNTADGYSALGNEILATATSNVPSSGTTCNGTYTGTFQGNITLSAGQNCIFVSGGVNGNVQENSGNLVLTQSQVSGNVQVNGGGTFTIGPGSTIGGNLQIQGLPNSAGQNQVCGTIVDGNLQFQNNGTAVLIGSTNPAACAGNTVDGNLEVTNNSGATAVAGNTVTGNLQDNNNTGATQVFNNMVGNNLQCQLNSSITGGGNTAGSKQGQCATF